MTSQEKTQKNSKKKWSMVAVFAALLIIISFVLVFLSREKPAVISPPAARDSKSEKLPPANNAEPTVVSNQNENLDPVDADYNTAASQNTISAYQEYLKKYPSAGYVTEVEKRIKELQEMPEPVRKAAEKASMGIKVKKNEKEAWEADFGDGIIMIYIPPGKFIMGTDAEEGQSDEKPAHEVYLDGYWLGKYEVTFDQYDKYCEETQKEKPLDGNFGRGKMPASMVSWHDGVEYCNWLSAKTGFHFKLPTEAQWEKAARGTNALRFPWGNQDIDKDLANFREEEEVLGAPTPVGSYPRGISPYGLLDMAGNLWEWCDDWHDWYKVDTDTPIQRDKDLRSLNNRAARSGCWFDEPIYLRASNRYGLKPDYRGFIVGIRLCMEIK